MSLPWPGVLEPSLLKDEVVAKAARWSEVLELLELQRVSVNQWRVGGASWFSASHQAAWRGASDSVVTGAATPARRT